ncbi:MAG TPA: hypothetical protein VFI65_34485 [Streptosporangiaceae bacterium]|nr:hypothetical protein [Streptosporangiaceae bacterium]
MTRLASSLPTAGMIATRVMELRRRRGLMITLIAVDIGLPALFLVIRLVLHVFAPRTSPPAGGSTIFAILAAGFLPTFGFFTAVIVGCTAGSRDLAEGMFRHLVITGRSRLALFLARIPAGLAIIVPLLAISYTVVCAVSVFAAPTFIDDWNLNVPPGLTRAEFVNFAREHAEPVICALPYNGRLPQLASCAAAPQWSKSTILPAKAASPRLEALAARIARQDYRDYAGMALAPSASLMIKVGLWIELQAAVIFVVGLGLASLMGQRTGPVVLLLAFQLIVTPILAFVTLPQLQFLRRSVVGLALARLEPSGLPAAAGLPGVTGGVGGPGSASFRYAESGTEAVIVLVAWLVAWTMLGAWRMMTRDA